MNPTPLPGLAFRQFDQNGDLDCVVTLRGTFEHVQDGVARWRDEQMPLQWQDAYEGDPHETPMLHQSDLVPEKPGTDVTFLGASHAPQGPSPGWTCQMDIGPIRKRLHVSGPRAWKPVVKPARWPFRRHEAIVDWELTRPDPTESVPMDWRHASGGPNVFEDAERDEHNPLGRGRIGPKETWQNHAVPAPQVSAEAEMTPASGPAGLGPVPPFWRQRARYAGTYDDDWKATRHPLLPKDFDPRFWQCAPKDQVVAPYLQANESYCLTNLHPEYKVASGRLPGLNLAVRVDEGGWIPLHLDGVQFDWRKDTLILLTWRARFPLPEALGVKLHLGWWWQSAEEAAA
ncbi:DUF2169 family type VI secretion system accessory protein [Paracoccus pacificus]|uniref:DUF2169 domain-containing protein n=1 Tax=Paracoccus pacificus TaxID=1463598 RepID=A0ABW4R9Y9_9RHOB